MAGPKQAARFEIEVAGEPYVWWLQRKPHWSSNPAERRGMGIAVCHRAGKREAVLEFPPGDKPRFGAPQLKPEQISTDLVARAIASAIDAGWEPLSRGKTVTVAVDAAGG